MSDIYHLRKDQSAISFEVKVGTIGNAATSVTQRRSGNVAVPIKPSPGGINGDVPVTPLGVSSDLDNSTLVITTLILLGKNDDLDQAFQNLFHTVTLHGGLDGDQTYPIHDNEKTKFPGTKSIVATKAIKLQAQQN